MVASAKDIRFAGVMVTSGWQQGELLYKRITVCNDRYLPAAMAIY